MEQHIREILKAVGEDPDREGLLRTPQRVAQALTFLTRGYEMDPAKVINDALFTEEYEEMIVQKIEMAARQSLDFGQRVVNRLGIERFSPFEKCILVAKIAGMRTAPRNHN